MKKDAQNDSLVIGNLRKYQGLLNFTVTNIGLPEVIVNRLYLLLSKSVRCPHCRDEHCMACSAKEALMLSTEYEVSLDGNHSEYDLVPLTPDGANNLFTYKDGDSDIFGIDLRFHGGVAYCVKICADYFETKSQKYRHVETEEVTFFKVAGGGNTCKGRRTLNEWSTDAGAPPPDKKFCGQLNPVLYKIVIARMAQLPEFLSGIDGATLQAVEPDLLSLLKSPIPIVRKKVIFSLGHLGNDNNTRFLTPHLKDIHCKETAADALGKIGDPRATDALLECLTGYINNDIGCYGYSFQQRVLLALSKVADESVAIVVQNYIGKLDESSGSNLKEPATVALEKLRRKKSSRGVASTVPVLFLPAEATDTARLRVGAPVRILFFAANPHSSTRLALDEEFRDIKAKLRASEHGDRFYLSASLATRPADLHQELLEQQPAIVHFSGHGSGKLGLIFAGDSPNEEKLVSGDALRQLFSVLRDNVRIVVLNACYSREQAEAIANEIDFVVGMKASIGDKAAQLFAASFYRGIGFGRSIQTSFDLGVNAIVLEGLVSDQNVPQLVCRHGADARRATLIDTEKKLDPGQKNPRIGVPANTSVQAHFQEVVEMMPALLTEMRDDLSKPDNQLVREFVPLGSSRISFSHGKTRRFEYYGDDHDQLQNKIDLLEEYDFVRVVRVGADWRIYRMSNEFVQKLTDWNNAT